jgi:hypothetical protein
MPVSDISNIYPILRKIYTSSPRKILELGVGFGKYGCLTREILDAVNGVVRKGESDIYLCGVEGFPQYNNPNWDHYNDIIIEDFGDESKWQSYIGYDLVLAIDSLEHLDKNKSLSLIKHLVDNNRELIVSVPLGDCPQGAEFGNTFETHRSTWFAPDFYELRIENNYNLQTLHTGVCGVYSLSK